MVVSLRIPLRAGWVCGKTLPDVQSMLLLANLFGTTIDELVRGDVDEMRAMVEKNERRTKTFAVALAAVEVVVVTALAVTAVAGRDYLEPVLRLLLAVLVLAFSAAMLAARRSEGSDEARSAAELLGAATGESVEAARASGAALGMRVVLQVFTGLAVGIGVFVVGDALLDPAAFRKLAIVLAAAAALAGSFALGRFARPRNRFASSGPLPYPGQRGSLVLERRGKARLHVRQVRTFREPFRGP